MRHLLLGIWIFCCCISSKSQDANCGASQVKLPTKPRMAVNDFANLLDSFSEVIIEQKIRTYYAKTSNEIYVVTVDTLNGCNIFDLCLAYWKVWKFGSAEKNNGLLILLSNKDRKIRISTGKGLEDVLPNEQCSRILEKITIPKMKQTKYYEALNETIEEIMLVIGDKFTNEKSSYIHNE